MEKKKQCICCSVHDCKHCDCKENKCKLDEIKICNCGCEKCKEDTICDSYEKKETK